MDKLKYLLVRRDELEAFQRSLTLISNLVNSDIENMKEKIREVDARIAEAEAQISAVQKYVGPKYTLSLDGNLEPPPPGFRESPDAAIRQAIKDHSVNRAKQLAQSLKERNKND